MDNELTVREKGEQLINIWIDKVHQAGDSRHTVQQRERINAIECAISCADLTIETINSLTSMIDGGVNNLVRFAARLLYWKAIKEYLQDQLNFELEK